MRDQRDYMRAYYLANKERLGEHNRRWAKENAQKMRLYKRKYEHKNKEKLAEKRSKSEVRKEYQKQYGKKNRKRISAQQNQRKQTDLIFKLRTALRGRLNRALKGNFKSGSAVKDLGCSIQEFKTYLELRFLPGMTWDNYGKGDGKWNIDHIVPISKVDLSDANDLAKVCHYTNLQPMWHADNIRKGNR